MGGTGGGGGAGVGLIGIPGGGPGGPGGGMGIPPGEGGPKEACSIYSISSLGVSVSIVS